MRQKRGLRIEHSECKKAVMGGEFGSAGRNQILEGHGKEFGFNFHCDSYFKNITVAIM